MKPLLKINNIKKSVDQLPVTEQEILDVIRGKINSKVPLLPMEIGMLDTLYDRYCPGIKAGHEGGDIQSDYEDIL